MQDHASQYVSKPIKTIANAMPGLSTWVEHEIFLPILCSHSQNPAAGSVLKISYQVEERLLELFALDQYIAAFHNHATVRDMEFLVQAVACDVRAALGHAVSLRAEIIYNAVAQRQVIAVEAASSVVSVNN